MSILPEFSCHPSESWWPACGREIHRQKRLGKPFTFLKEVSALQIKKHWDVKKYPDKPLWFDDLRQRVPPEQ